MLELIVTAQSPVGYSTEYLYYLQYGVQIWCVCVCVCAGGVLWYSIGYLNGMAPNHSFTLDLALVSHHLRRDSPITFGSNKQNS